ncbi:MAG TPA: hypothetical protein DEA90_06550 [Opitutae bacterium]|nr:hypothetical protein [Puniceicoccaceae bacterium]HBR93808.1 hypothetical protein [Opitutae bacterium]|tara:strand:+ start:5076 stop:5795 length:720 start_codon:yes stop_codon:yes gene_type:complete
MQHTFKFLLLVSLLIGSITAQAQTEAPIKTSFSALSWNQSIRGIHYFVGSQRIDLSIPNGAPTPAYECWADRSLTFYKDGPKDASGEPISIPIASTTIASNTPDPLLLFIDQGNQTDQYRIAQIQLRLQANGQDLYRIFNLSEFNLMTKFDEKRLALDAGKDLTLTLPGINGPNFGVMIALQMPSETPQEWQLAYNTFWPYRAGRSGLIFISDRPNRPGKIDVRRYYIPTQTAPEPNSQ